MRKQIEGTKKNNKGFTLLEVLVAMVILTIICVPLLRSMATSAQTNAKAKIQSRCTMASENVMEQIRNMSVEDIYNTCSGLPNFSPVTPSGVEEDIHFDIVDNSVMNIDLPDGYTAKVDLNANVDVDGQPAYPNANGLNMSDFSPISVRDCAIYTMPKDMDKEAYDWFADRSSDFGRTYTREDFRKDLTRDIIVTIMDTGISYTDADGNTKNAVKVKMDIKYQCNTANAVDDDHKTYVKTSVFLFDNSITHNDFNGIYIFFYPRYTAANRGDSIRRDVIEVYNNANIKADFYAVAMNNGELENDADRDTYLMRGSKGLYLKIKEGSLGADNKAGISLKTNLLRTSSLTSLRTPYSTGDTATDYGLGLEVEYALDGGTTYRTFGDSDPVNICNMLSISDIDGKLLKNDTDVRIYKVTVSVYKNDDFTTPISKMEGTKLTTN